MFAAGDREHLEEAPRDGSPDFELQQVVFGARHRLILTGELDLAATQALAASVQHIPMDESTALILDLRKLLFIDSTGIRAILVIQELCAARGCEFLLVPGQAPVQRVFDICGLLDHLPFRDDEALVRSDPSGGGSMDGSVS